MLRAAQAALRSRFEDFRQALERRDGPAYRLALADFHDALGRWTAAEEQALVPALLRSPIPGRDARRELTLEFVQPHERGVLEVYFPAAAAVLEADELEVLERAGRSL